MYIYIINSIILLLLHFLFNKYKDSKFENLVWILVIFLLIIFIDLEMKLEVIGILIKIFFYQELPKLGFRDMLNASLVYVLINKIAYYLGIQFIGVNFISSIIFMFSLAFFLKNTPNRWLALAISFPIIILILGMGYARQGLAFSFSLF